jgi:leader peptidase (prepilin peptidase)/N-methyltransferase
MTPFALIATLIGLLGLVIGSFLNVVIYRVPREESILFPGSHCPACNSAVKARHNVPVLGWVALRGKCASCRSPISVRYPLVEAGTGLLYVAVTLRFGLSVELPAYLFLAATGVTLAMIDFDIRRLPSSIVLPAYLVSALLLLPAGAADGAWWPAGRGIIGAVTLSAIYFTLALAYPGGVTFGDVKLAGLLGLYLGWLSWSAILVGAIGGLLLGGVGGTALNAMRSRDGSIALALGPCMVAAAGAALFLTTPLIGWYASLAGAS